MQFGRFYRNLKRDLSYFDDFSKQQLGMFNLAAFRDPAFRAAVQKLQDCVEIPFKL